MADQQGLRVEPENVAGFGGAGGDDRAERRNAMRSHESTVMACFLDAVRLAGAHEDQAEVGGERGVVGIDRVEREIRRGGEFDDFRAGGREFVAERVVLRLGGGEVGRMMKAEFAPARDAFGLIPSGGARGGHQHALKRADHGVSVESHAGLGRCGQGVASCV